MVSDASLKTVPVITLDGLAGSGKSTLARRLAAALGWNYLDSGAWYRALTWAVLSQEGDPDSPQACQATLSSLILDATATGAVLIDGRDLGKALRTPAIDAAVAKVANHPEVRLELNRRMRRQLEKAGVSGLVADGRDAGSVIFPDAALQVFVAVPLTERARRRFDQYCGSGTEITFSAVEEALASRDASDLARGDAAPRLTARGRELQNQHTVEEAIGVLLSWAKECGFTPESTQEAF